MEVTIQPVYEGFYVHTDYEEFGTSEFYDTLELALEASESILRDFCDEHGPTPSSSDKTAQNETSQASGESRRGVREFMSASNDDVDVYEAIELLKERSLDNIDRHDNEIDVIVGILEDVNAALRSLADSIDTLNKTNEIITSRLSSLEARVARLEYNPWTQPYPPSTPYVPENPLPYRVWFENDNEVIYKDNTSVD